MMYDFIYNEKDYKRLVAELSRIKAKSEKESVNHVLTCECFENFRRLRNVDKGCNEYCEIIKAICNDLDILLEESQCVYRKYSSVIATKERGNEKDNRKG